MASETKLRLWSRSHDPKAIRENSVLPSGSSGGCGIRTREGLHPTRFPSERHRPLGESSARNLTGHGQRIRTEPGSSPPR